MFTLKNNSTLHQFLKYLLVSLAGLCMDMSILIGGVELFGLPALLAAFIGFSMGMVVVYTLSIYWVFDKRRFVSQRLEFILFFKIGLIGLGLTELILWVGLKLGVYYLIAKLAATGLVFAWNFGARKFILFR